MPMWNGEKPIYPHRYRRFRTGFKGPDLYPDGEQCQLAMEEADVILFVMDGKEGLTPSDKEIADLLRRQEKPVFLCGQ